MKHFFALFLIIALPFIANSASPNEFASSENFSYDNTVLEINEVGEPYEKDNHIIFTAPHNARFIGIAFDFEEYKRIHPFRIHYGYDMDNNKTDSLMFYILEKPRGRASVSYRLVIDGIWTCDPYNPDSYYDEVLGLDLSRVTFRESLPLEFVPSSSEGTRFVYEGRPGQKIYITGTFTNWDPWIYELSEIFPGTYEIYIPLTRGTYYYNFFVGMKPINDKRNTRKVYTKDGRSASVITVR
ncbi:MAG: glycogen-binding domain-containing protein [Treponema sp.]|nr:glycogen-binding domain-containing protein [Treponema sp.]